MGDWRRTLRAMVVVLFFVSLGVGSGAITYGAAAHHRAANSMAAPATTAVVQQPPVVVASAPHLVRWHGPVAGIFVHPLVLQPRLAFTDDPLGRGFANYFVTAREFRAILDQLWRNGWTLVDVHRAARGDVLVPPGRKPLVLSEDDVNYYAYFQGRGLADRLVLDRGGNVRAEFHDASGEHLTDEDVVPLVDEMVAAHPEFSAGGAKGVIAVTGYEGLLGEHDLTDPAARARVRALAARMTATGWTFASHTYGHIHLGTASIGAITRDTARWRTLAEPLLGSTDVLIYPYGMPPTSAGLRVLRGAGFGIHVDIDVTAKRAVRDGVVVLSRLHVDGYAFDNPRRMAPLFDVAAVRDAERPPG